MQVTKFGKKGREEKKNVNKLRYFKFIEGSHQIWVKFNKLWYQKKYYLELYSSSLELWMEKFKYEVN